MSILKSKTATGKKQTNTNRRSFMLKMGAGVSTALAATVPGMAKSGTGEEKDLKNSVDSLSMQVAMLEEENMIRQLHQTYENLMDNGMYENVPDLFADDAEVTFNGGVFKNKNRGIDRLYREHFHSGMTGKLIEPAPGFELDTDQMQDVVEVAPDRLSAKAAFTYSIQVGMPIDSDSILVEMARLQGEGIQKWWEGGVYDLSYVKDVKDGSWKIHKLEYKTLSRADYRPGRSYASPISVSQFSKLYPDEAAGPDRLIQQIEV